MKSAEVALAVLPAPVTRLSVSSGVPVEAQEPGSRVWVEPVRQTKNSTDPVGASGASPVTVTWSFTVPETPSVTFEDDTKEVGEDAAVVTSKHSFGSRFNEEVLSDAEA